MVRATERILNSFHKKVEALRQAGADMDAFDTFEVSGIAGTQMEDTLSFDVAQLADKTPARQGRNRLGQATSPAANWARPARASSRCSKTTPDVEADTPWRRWLEAAADGKKQSADSGVAASSRFATVAAAAPTESRTLRIPARPSALESRELRHHANPQLEASPQDFLSRPTR